MRYEFAEQYKIVCVVIQPGDTADKVIQDAIENDAVLVDESDEQDDEYCVRFPGRPQELYTARALKRSKFPAGQLPGGSG